MDLSISLTCLLVFSPLMLIIAAVIKLGSKGPVVYKQERVGANYKIFKLYKFRSMSKGADDLANQIALKDIYIDSEETTSSHNSMNSSLLIGNDGEINEESHLKSKSTKTFRKFKNDPRVTRFGKFIRKTSLDELPQLLNVVKGDLSVVGNRPLPLYEAETLVKNDSVRRFLAPAGLTGLWQVKRKESKYRSAESRIKLDIKYAKEYSFLSDLGILIKTPFAMLQESST
jgi:lipopolysaccharide/colanic/teichoic acid biosynthesis glycosyltransferase